MNLGIRIPILGLAAALAGCQSSPSAMTTAVGACHPAPGVVCFGSNNYLEYDAGDLPIVISVPHGGSITPSNMPDRTGTTVTDSNTIELGRAIAQAFVARTGHAPHVIVCLLRRTKLDANREVGDAAQGNTDAIQAWTEYHEFVELATHQAAGRARRGFYIDLHGHGHAKQRLELGYLLADATLNRSDAELDAGNYYAQSSLHLLPLGPSGRFSALLRGPSSFGGLLEPAVPSVPSPSIPSPGDDPYFDGGYSTDRHTRAIPGLQIESNFTGIRDTAANRAAFAERLVEAVIAFMNLGI